jgi:hypothetical protein
MRLLRAVLSIAISMMMVVGPVWAQGKQAQNTDTLRQKVAQLEQIDIGSKPVAQQIIFKRSLLNIYTQFHSALEQEIVDLASMQRAVSDAALQRDIDNQLQELKRERELVLSKMGGLKSALQTAAAPDLSPTKAATTPAPQVVQAAYNRPADNMTPQGASVSFANTNATPVSSIGNLTTTATLPATPTDIVVSRPAPARQAASSCYPDAPPVLVTAIHNVAIDIVNSTEANKLDELAGSVDNLLLYALIDASLPPEDAIQFRGLAAYQYLGETARTDKHLEPSPTSAGGTNLGEKPSVPQLLGLFIGRGAVKQETSDTALTLSTTLNNLLTFGQDYMAEDYEKHGFLKRIGVSTSFSLTNQDQVLANARRSQLQEWSIKARLYGERDTRSAAFSRFWVDKIKPNIQRRLNVLTAAHSALNADASIRALETSVENDLRAKLRGVTSQEAIENGLLCGLKELVYDKVKAGTITPSDTVKAQLASSLNDLKDAHKNLEEARTLLNAFLDDFMGQPLLTFGYTNHRQVAASDYSEFKLLYEQGMSDFRQMKVNANAVVTMYHNPNRTMNQQKLRDISATLSLEGKLDRFYLVDAPDLSKITYSFTGNYQRLFENRRVAERKADIASAQFRLEIPLFSGLSFPLSATYSNATEFRKKDHVKFSAGLNFDMDKLIAITNLTSPSK